MCLLTLVATPEIEERLVDWLLEAGHKGFTTAACQGHGINTERLSVAEQVAGRQRRVVFWIVLPENVARLALSQLGADFREAGLHYWLSPVVEAGRIDVPDRTTK